MHTASGQTFSEGNKMYLNDLLEQKNITKYRLSKTSGVPYTTISEITTGKSNIKNCTGDTLYKLAKALDVTIEELLAESMIKRPSSSPRYLAKTRR